MKAHTCTHRSRQGTSDSGRRRGGSRASRGQAATRGQAPAGHGAGGFLTSARCWRTGRGQPGPSPRPTALKHGPAGVSRTRTKSREALLSRRVEAVGHGDGVNVQKVTERKGKTSRS